MRSWPSVCPSICEALIGSKRRRSPPCVWSSDPGGRWSRLGLEGCLKRGYVRNDIPHGVCRTLDFTYCDSCIGQVATHVGRDETRRPFRKRTKIYRHLWHAGRDSCGRGRGWSVGRAVGRWDWGPAYIEGGPWQHSWTVPHDWTDWPRWQGDVRHWLRTRTALRDPAPLRDRRLPRRDPRDVRDGPGPRCQRPELWAIRSLESAIHLILWQLYALGRPGSRAEQLARVCRDLYTPDDLPGDEDNGEMSAWYLLSAVRQHRLCPGGCPPKFFHRDRSAAEIKEFWRQRI